MNKLYRFHKKLDVKENYTFQTLEWNTYDEDLDGCGDKYIIRAFGVDNKGYSVCCTIKDYIPYFYIKIPKYWSIQHVLNFLEELKKVEKNGKKALNYYVKDTLLKNKCKIEYFKEFYGFTNNENVKFCKLMFTTEKGMKAYKYAISNTKKIEVYEVNIETLLKFFHERNIQPSNWIQLSEFEEQEELEAHSTCQINIECTYEDVIGKNESFNSNFLQASYDIETYSKSQLNDDGKEYYPFPTPEKQENVIYQIATCFKRFLEKDFEIKILLTLKKCKKIEDSSVYVIECETEKELLLKWKSIIQFLDPDVLYQYNGDMFDCSYMVKRAEMLNIKENFMNISRLYDYPAELKEECFSSSAYGTTNYKRLKIPGRINFDILIFLKREFKENSYKLGDIAFKYVGEKKLDVSVKEIFKAYEQGTEEQIQRIGMYCVQDTLLPQNLVDVLHIFQTQISMSNVTHVPIRYLIERGQQIKALSQIAKISKKKGYLLPFFQYSEENEKFQGATVLEPDSGLYDTPITVLDFASLYPSIIMAHDLCYTTIVLKKEYLNLPGINYHEVDLDGRKYYYAKNQDSVLKNLLLDLSTERTKYKRLMGSTDDINLKEIYNKTQLAYKISMNSCYGILGTSTIGCKPIAASVTRIGREMIKQTKEYIENNHHNVYPEGYEHNDLDPEDLIKIKYKEEEITIKVKELNDIKGKGDDVYIKTNKGWRIFL